jgi:hypothetical protein
MPYLVIKNKIVQEEYSIFPSEKIDSFSELEKHDFEKEWEVVGGPFENEEDAASELREKLSEQQQNERS